MAWSAPRHVVAGDLALASQFNVDVVDNLSYLYNTQNAQAADIAARAALAGANTFSALNYFNGGIQFPSGNILIDYRVGTWTPVLQFGGNNTGIVYSSQNGWYVKIGSFVHCALEIRLTNKGVAAGVATVAGFPFSPAYQASVVAGHQQNMTGNPGGGVPYLNSPLMGWMSGTTWSLEYVDANGNAAQVYNTHFANNSVILASTMFR